MTRIKHGSIGVGRPLEFNCYDSKGTLLLRLGQTVASASQLEALLARGLFVKPPARAKADQAPFDLFENCKDGMRALFARIRRQDGADLPERIAAIGQDIQALCQRDADAALGAVHLDRVCRYTTVHPLHKAIVCELVAARMGVPVRERLSILAAALTANISAIELQESLQLHRAPLTEAHREAIRLHPLLSAEMLRAFGVRDGLWIDTVLQHHEKLDGSGYPHARRGTDVSRYAQLVGLADVYCAMVKTRAYRGAVHGKEALRRLFLDHGARMDSALVQVFIKEIGIYPPGSFVKLQNGETAVVTRRGKSSATPRVKSILDPRGMPLADAIRRDTAGKAHAIAAIVPRVKTVAIDFSTLWDYGYQGSSAKRRPGAWMGVYTLFR